MLILRYVIGVPKYKYFLTYNYLCSMNYSESIVSISTPPGMGAIAIIRLSGNDGIEIIERIFRRKKPGSDLQSVSAGKVVLGSIQDGDELIDEVLVTCFHAPHSYTGEDVIEISCHGSVFIQERILQLILDHGVRLAGPGEFTMRAFMNGKMDLAQAEAVADLISSTNSQHHRLALQQMRGGVSGKLKQLRSMLVEFAALIELELDFSLEDVEFADRSSLRELLSTIKGEIRSLYETFRLGNAIKRGIPVAIIGKPNAGKSTLLNALLEEEKAIVSEIPGTTRDAIEDTIVIGNIPFRFIDTAGLRETEGKIEAIGIEKTYEKISQANIVLYIFDASNTDIEEVKEDLASLFLSLSEMVTQEELAEKRFIIVANKIDVMVHIPHHFSDYVEMEVVFISAKRHENLFSLTTLLEQSVDPAIYQEKLMITNLRHYEALQHSLDAIAEAEEALINNLPADLAAVDIRKALYHLGLITGEVSDDELLQTIFGRFCIGK